jgi:hypothetical protein
VRLSSASSTGYIVHSHAGDDWRACQAYIAARLGIDAGYGRAAAVRHPKPAPRYPAERAPLSSCEQWRQRAVATLWREAQYPRGTIVEAYLASRCLALPDGIAGEVIRYHPACPWGEGDGTIRVPAMVAALRSIHGDELVGVHRTRLTPDGRKVDRRMLGTAEGTAVKLDADAEVTIGLAIGEGIETCLAARQLGIRPVWALGSAGAIERFPLLAGIDALTILIEHDANGTNQRASEACAARWHAAGREVLLVDPLCGKDISDAIREVAA